MTDLSTRLRDLATRLATEDKTNRTFINGNAPDLSDLDTTAKSNLVEALNELKGLVDAAAAAAAAKAAIDDAAVSSTTKTYSIDKISALITAAIDGVVAGAPTAINTLNELATAIGDDANFAATITAALGNRVRVDTAAQGLTEPQKGNARTNIGAAAAADVGVTDTDFVAIFEAGLS